MFDKNALSEGLGGFSVGKITVSNYSLLWHMRDTLLWAYTALCVIFPSWSYNSFLNLKKKKSRHFNVSQRQSWEQPYLFWSLSVFLLSSWFQIGEVASWLLWGRWGSLSLSAEPCGRHLCLPQESDTKTPCLGCLTLFQATVGQRWWPLLLLLFGKAIEYCLPKQFWHLPS